MLDSTPTGINAKPVEVLVVHVSAALIDVACQVKQQQPASQSLTAFRKAKCIAYFAAAVLCQHYSSATAGSGYCV
jgi:hypothetical protein